MKRDSGSFARRLAFAVCPVLAMCLSISHVLAQSPSPSKSDSDDVILINGKIITVDGKDSVAQALAIHDGKIVAVGSNDEIKARMAKHPRVIDLHGRTATPGLIDTHCHFDETERIYGIELSKITRVSEAVELVRQKISSSKPGEWASGSGWDEGKLTELRYITAADLDKVSPDNPVWLGHTTGHYGVANSYALHLAKISQETKDPKGGIIDRDAAGRPTGVLKEEAMGLVTSLIPPFSKDQQRIGVLKMMADFNSEGMTAAKDPGTEGIRWDLYQEILKEKQSTVRIFALLYGGRAMESARAVFDRAIDCVVDTYADLWKEKPTKGLRHGIIHCNIPTDHAIDTLARLQRDYDSGYPETQAPFMWWIGDNYAASFGATREQRLMPYKNLHAKKYHLGQRLGL